jgi:glycosyltransferase involved in cell wall biosynthesis
MKAICGEGDLFLLSRVSPDEAPFLDEVRTECKEIRTLRHRVATGAPGNVVERIRSYLELGRAATRWARERRFDLLQIEHVEAAVAVRPPPEVPLVVDCHDVITKPRERIYRSSGGGARLLAWGIYRTARSIEARVMEKSALAFVRSPAEGEYLRRLSPVPYKVIPHPCRLQVGGGPRIHDGATVLFLGALHRDLNVDGVRYFVSEVWPRVRESIPAARFHIVGVNPPAGIRALESPGKGIRVVGPVDSIEDAYLSASVFVAPIRVGGGMIVKNLDAMSTGVPVVTTTYGNEGIGASPGDEILVADDPAAFADAVVRLLADSDANRRIGERGRNFVRRAYSPEAIRRIVLGSYRELLLTRSVGGGA